MVERHALDAELEPRRRMLSASGPWCSTSRSLPRRSARGSAGGDAGGAAGKVRCGARRRSLHCKVAAGSMITPRLRTVRTVPCASRRRRSGVPVAPTVLRRVCDCIGSRWPAMIDDGSPLVALRGVGKVYGGGALAVHALRDVDLEIGRGELVVVLGPSGSGKTTLLNLIGAIEPPTSGTVRVAGWTSASSMRRSARRSGAARVGFVFQFFNLIPTLTALENVELIAEIAARDGALDAAGALREVGLGDRLDHFPAPAVGRRAAARRGRPCPGRAAAAAAVRRADRCAGSRDRPRRARAAAAGRAPARAGPACW